MPGPRSGRVWVWVLVAVGGVTMLLCGGVVAWVVYLAAYGPETSVYTGNQVPRRYIEIMKSVGALDDDETILYFYSDAMTDIRDGFYFVSDKKVVVYVQSAEEPLTVVHFDEIAMSELRHSDALFTDGEITLMLKDGRPISFPVSGESGKDQKFLDAIRQRMGKGEPQQPLERVGTIARGNLPPAFFVYNTGTD
jgi:hypothetical protein